MAVDSQVLPPSQGGIFLSRDQIMLRSILCCFVLHGKTEFDYTDRKEEIKVCKDCLKAIS
ncbi:hypothetical protein BS636_13715 [Acinetobacter sp. LoGeW2-3]|nr:hypothetical protein BS636_13715 [Acinetobacter sp. LoGeW2-3]